MAVRLKVKGMHCKSCELLLTDAIEEIANAKVISIDHKTGSIELDCNPSSLDSVKAAVRKEGYSI